MGVISDGSYGAPENVIFSFPVICKNKEWTIVKGLATGTIAGTNTQSKSLATDLGLASAAEQWQQQNISSNITQAAAELSTLLNS
jgi:hypothetical protein